MAITIEHPPQATATAPPSWQPIQVLRFALPLFLFVLATGFEVWEHMLEGENLFIDTLGLLEIFVFGVLGPLAVYIVLTYVVRLMGALEDARARTTRINQNLEALVTERTAALQTSNTELAVANLRLREVDEMKSDFVALVSHELRAPLATLNGGLEVARQYEDSLPAKARRVLNVLSLETERLTHFVQTMLDVSQLENGRLQLTCGPVALKPMLDRAAEVTLGDEATRLVWQLPEDLPPVVADEMYIEQAVRNLLRNAQKYAPPQTPIILSATVIDRAVNIGVTDFGPGIPADEQAHVFDRFYRARNADRRKVGGWGLGLYFARALTEAQGGTVVVESPVRPDKDAPGSRFIISLPVAEEEPDHVTLVAD
jgi:signal transduction histidine kinase